MANIKATQTSARTGESNRNDWGTPWWLIHLLEEEFGPIDLDPCASPESAKAPVFFTEEQDGLSQTYWGTVFINPPYSQIALWARKAYTEAWKGHTKNVLFLCAARTDTRIWWDYIQLGEVRFIKGRLKFIGAKSSAPFPSALVVFSHKMSKSPTTVYWDIPKELRKSDG